MFTYSSWFFSYFNRHQGTHKHTQNQAHLHARTYPFGINSNTMQRSSSLGSSNTWKKKKMNSVCKKNSSSRNKWNEAHKINPSQINQFTMNNKNVQNNINLYKLKKKASIFKSRTASRISRVMSSEFVVLIVDDDCFKWAAVLVLQSLATSCVLIIAY